MKAKKTASTSSHAIQPRKVAFDLSRTPLQWIPGQPFASQVINAAHLFLPAGEFHFCKVFNAALPYVTDAKLREDVQAFVRQEAMHARAHENAAQAYLAARGIETGTIVRRVQWLVEEGPLALQPFGRAMPRRLQKQWLIFLVGVIAAVEHLTCFMGQYILGNQAWEAAGGDPAMIDLARWHGAEEIEHRCVAFDLYRHLGGSYPTRYYLMVVSMPLLTALIASSATHLMRQDPALKHERYHAWSPRFWREWSRVSTTGHVPALGWLLRQQARYLLPWYHPIREGSTGQALAYLASSPGVRCLAAA